MTDEVKEEAPNPIVVATLAISEKFNGAIGNTLNGLLDKMKAEPVWANSVLAGALKLEINAAVDEDSQRLIASIILEACKAHGTCRRCNGTMEHNGGACDWCLIPRAEAFNDGGD